MEITEIEQLIEEARNIKASWRKPKVNPKLSDRTWQEILDGGVYPKFQFSKI